MIEALVITNLKSGSDEIRQDISAALDEMDALHDLTREELIAQLRTKQGLQVAGFEYRLRRLT